MNSHGAGDDVWFQTARGEEEDPNRDRATHYTGYSDGLRLVAHFQAGESVKRAREIRKWAQKGFGGEFEKWPKPGS